MPMALDIQRNSGVNNNKMEPSDKIARGIVTLERETIQRVMIELSACV